MKEKSEFQIIFSPHFEKVVRKLKRKKPDLVREISLRLPRLTRNPELGKPLTHELRAYRRLHISGSHVLLYEIHDNEVRLIDFDHHDRVYEKYSKW